ENIQTTVIYRNQQGTVIDPPAIPGEYTVEVEIVEEGYEPLKRTVQLIIQKASLVVEVHEHTINYGEGLPEFTFSITGFVNGEDQNVLTAIPVVNNPGNNLLPGDYPLEADGGMAPNYEFIYLAGNLKIIPLYVNDIIIQDTIVTYSTLTSNIGVTTVPAGLDYHAVFYNSENNPVNPVNAGTYHFIVTITETGYYNTQVTGQLYIQKAPLEVTMLPLQITYGAQQPEPEITFSGWLGNEDATVIDQLPEIAKIVSWPWNVGSYSLNYIEGSDNNYQMIYTGGELQVLPATLTVIPDDLVLDYNQTLPELTYTITGFQYAEDLSVIGQLPFLQVEGEWPLAPGSYPIVASDASALNYVFDYQNGHLWIEPIGDAAILVSKLDTVYTGTIHWPGIVTIPSGLAHDTIVSELPLNAGSYELKVKLTEPGYIPIEESQLIQIEKAILTVTARDTAVSKGADIGFFNIDYEGFVNNESIDDLDQLPTASAGNVPSLEAGTHAIVLQGGHDNNYAFTFINGILTIVPTYLLEVIAGENGMVSYEESGDLHAMLSAVVTEGESSPEFYAIADENFRFSGWNNGSTDNPLSFTNVTQNHRVTALFEAKVGVDESATNSSLKVYPNPVAAYHPFKVNIQLSHHEKVTLILSDISGQVIAKKTVTQRVQQFDGLQQGIYLITLSSEQQSYQPMKLLVR
ncbi:MAG: T9SS type A sorting domain-containing protein, partial [Prolixibacteraceae bacterium]|nr:T9SS type A sorting domain-containing protein [Prolixibacteraceae bacterium]